MSKKSKLYSFSLRKKLVSLFSFLQKCSFTLIFFISNNNNLFTLFKPQKKKRIFSLKLIENQFQQGQSSLKSNKKKNWKDSLKLYVIKRRGKSGRERDTTEERKKERRQKKRPKKEKLKDRKKMNKLIDKRTTEWLDEQTNEQLNRKTGRGMCGKIEWLKMLKNKMVSS